MKKKTEKQPACEHCFHDVPDSARLVRVHGKLAPEEDQFVHWYYGNRLYRTEALVRCCFCGGCARTVNAPHYSHGLENAPKLEDNPLPWPEGAKRLRLKTRR